MPDVEVRIMEKFLGSIGLEVSDLMAVLKALLLFVIFYIIIKLLTKAISKLLNRSRLLEPSLKSFFNSATKTVLWAIAVMIIASALGINITSLVALLSVAGVALSLALQGLLANVFSGILILTSRPFAVGDEVTLSGQSGWVRSIGIFYTSIATYDNRVVHIPNGDITSSVIVNGTSEALRRVDIAVETSYDCKTEDVRAALLEAAANSKYPQPDPAPCVFLASYKASNIEFVLRVWCKSDEYFAAVADLNERVRESYDRHGIVISYDQLIVKMDKN